MTITLMFLQVAGECLVIVNCTLFLKELVMPQTQFIFDICTKVLADNFDLSDFADTYYTKRQKVRMY